MKPNGDSFISQERKDGTKNYDTFDKAAANARQAGMIDKLLFYSKTNFTNKKESASFHMYCS